MPREVSPPNPPPRPRPFLLRASTVAFAWRSRSTTESWPCLAAKCSGVLPQEPRPEAKPQAEPNRTNWEKLWVNFDASRVKVCFCGHSISSMDLTNTAVLRCLEVIELAEKAMSTTVAVQMIWYHHSLFNLHRPASFCKKQDISAGCIQTMIRIIRIPHSRQSMAQPNGTKLLQAIAYHCIMSLHHQSFRVIKQHLWDSYPLHLSSARGSRRCE